MEESYKDKDLERKVHMREKETEGGRERQYQLRFVDIQSLKSFRLWMQDLLKHIIVPLDARTQLGAENVGTVESTSHCCHLLETSGRSFHYTIICIVLCIKTDEPNIII